MRVHRVWRVRLLLGLLCSRGGQVCAARVRIRDYLRAGVHYTGGRQVLRR